VSIKYTYEYVKNYIESFDYTLLSDTYKSNRTKLLVKCDKGHEYGVTLGNFKAGYRCPECLGVKRNTYEYVKQYIESDGSVLLSDNYTNNRVKLVVECSKHHIYKIRFNNFQQGQGCPVCGGTQKHTYEHVKQYIESVGYVLLSDSYINDRTKLLIKCDEGHEYNVTFNTFSGGRRCPACWFESSSSVPEKEVQQFVSSILDCDVIYNDRTQIVNPLTSKNLELDIWIPSMKKAIEYNGAYWHSMKYQMIKDCIKQERCKQKGIDLLIVTDHNWLNNNEFERQKIKMWLDNMY